MGWQYPIWTPERSFRRGFNVWDLYYTLWGNTTLGTGNGFFPDATRDGPVRLPNFHGIAIGARSTVERVMVQTQLVADLVVGQGGVPVWVDGLRVIDFAACHIGMPLRGQVLGPVTIYADEVYNAATTYIPDNGTYAPALLVSAAFEQPALHLQFVQRKQDVTLLGGQRMPMIRHVSVFEDPIIGAEELLKIYPIAGRRGVTFQAVVDGGAAVVSYRLAVIGATQQGGAGPDALIEKSLAAVAACSPTTSPAYIDLTGRAQYLAIYRTIAGNPGETATHHFDVTITDDCCGEGAVALGGGGV